MKRHRPVGLGWFAPEGEASADLAHEGEPLRHSPGRAGWQRDRQHSNRQAKVTRVDGHLLAQPLAIGIGLIGEAKEQQTLTFLGCLRTGIASRHEGVQRDENKGIQAGKLTRAQEATHRRKSTGHPTHLYER